MMNITIHKAIDKGVTSIIVYKLSFAETCYKTIEDKRNYIDRMIKELNQESQKSADTYHVFEINKCLLIYYELTHTVTVKFEL